MSIAAFPQVSSRRRRTDRLMRALLVVATGIALVPLILIVFYLLKKGLSSWTSAMPSGLSAPISAARLAL